ncbi:aminoglycoside phosphotransferase family protein [Paenibacillus humicola]|uniref:aminoglycoside phosphotransferase family protein n=1 Tax=Paenibacillus humicola TaxID=3110540 RepID=UPI00237C43C9|nr:aminoglycoside phosphotransferase family protein [Paenibacillus humicola]
MNNNEHEDPRKNEEVVLSAEKSVARQGDVVLRPSGPWTPHVHALLRDLRKRGFTSVPSIIGSGLDQEGREMLSYIEGEFVHPGPWRDEAIVEVGRMLRRLHDASAQFKPAADAVWKPWFLRDLGGSNRVYSHGDVAPWNMVTRDGMPVALIDWEFAGPVDPMVELARVCWLFPQLHDDDVAERVGLPSLQARARQLRLLADAYGASPAQRHSLFHLILEVVVRETAEEAIEMQITPDRHGPLWGIAWRARAAAWILRNRTVLQNALEQ